MYVYADVAMWKRQHGEVPSFPCSGIRMMQQPGLGAVAPSQLLSNVIPSVPAPGSSSAAPTGIDLNTPLLIGGLALLGVGILFFYGRKVQRRYKSAQLKRVKRRARIQALESELALAKAS